MTRFNESPFFPTFEIKAMKTTIMNFIKSAIKPGAVIKEIKASPEGGVGNLYRPSIVKMVVRGVFFWGVLAMLLFAMGKGFITIEDVEELIKIIKE